ncbi:serine/threonine-protein kinase SRPK3 [Diplogelasinospora grovesii]|uniref:Serine/threonine-protein kinase SRPK3 n=1 Tax=Diplogelasinospora grovesii TaxID=303347 RepID=A0AAN6S1Y7_9PEZI|nr:serine/threonine-protein kinase SRPK3 [Diplogelasinospora grovesii]
MSAPSTPPPQDPVSERDYRFRETGIPSDSPSIVDSVHRYVALKIEVAKLQGAEELTILQHLASKAPQDADSQFVVALLESFNHDGPNGRHLCLVLEPMGPSISSVLNASAEKIDLRNLQDIKYPRLSKQQTKAILRNVLRGLRFLHSNGVVHGDLQSGNMLFAIRDLSSIGVEQLRQDQTRSEIDVLERADGKVDKWAPKYLVVEEPLKDYVLPEPNQIVKIADMGGAFLENDPPQSVVTPAALRAPESILGCPLSCSIDIWSLGCLIFEFLTNLPLFQLPLGNRDESLDDDHLIQLTDIIQPLPGSLLVKWPRATRYYGPDGERLSAQPWDFDGGEWSGGEDDEGYDEFDDLEEDELPMERPGPPKPYDPLEKLFRDNKDEDIDEEEEKVIVSLLRSILQHDPLKRPSAADLLEHPWIKD